MERLPNRLRYWRRFVDWYSKDESYWYFPKGRIVQSDEVIRAFRTLTKLEGENWRDVQAYYLDVLASEGLFKKRAAHQTDSDSTAMARMWKVVFSTLGIAWVEDDEKVLITDAGVSFLSTDDPTSVIEGQVQKYQLSNPTVGNRYLQGLEVRPHIFLLEVLLNCDSYISNDEYTLFVSRVTSI